MHYKHCLSDPELPRALDEIKVREKEVKGVWLGGGSEGGYG